VLPTDWRAADRPGTSVEQETNDYTLVRPPGRAPLLIAAYYDAPGVSMDSREAVLREAGMAFVKWATTGA
jgi:beta-lactamase class A